MRLRGLPLRDEADGRLRPPPGFASLAASVGGVHRRGIGASHRSFRLATTAVRWMAKGGAGSGTTPEDPKGTVWQLLNVVNQPTTIYVLEGDGSDLDLATGIAGSACVDDVELIVVRDFTTLEPGTRRFTLAAPLVWSAVGGGVYSAPMAGAYAFAPYNVIDEAFLDAYGGGAWLTPVADQAAVTATPGAWAKVGTNIFVRTTDSRAPDAQVLVMKNVNHASSPIAGKHVYFEGVELLGGAQPFSKATSGTVTLARCKARYGRVGGFTFNGATRANILDCAVTGNGADGITYTSTPLAVEVGVSSCKNGDPTIAPANTHNGSTVHSGGRIIALNCDYRDNQGPNGSHVGGAQVWWVGCRASGSTATQSTQKLGVHIQGTGWLDDCDLTGNDEAAVKAELLGDVVNVYNCRGAADWTGAGLVRESRG
jgi:hypothetical protein